MFFQSTLCPKEMHVAYATLRTKADRKPMLHCFFDQRISWLEFNDDLPQFNSDHPELAHYQKVRKQL